MKENVEGNDEKSCNSPEGNERIILTKGKENNCLIADSAEVAGWH